MNLRLLDLGGVSALRSQSIYHGVAAALRPDDPGAVSILYPTEPYVCIGFHQEAEREIDLEACRDLGLPVIRRQVGGGAVYLDSNQLFFHFVLNPKDPDLAAFPLKFEERFRLFTRAPIEVYRSYGISAEFRPVNDLQVAGRKIGGTGGGDIGDAFVFVGSLLLDFDVETMTKVLKVPSEKMRDKIHQSLGEYITTVRRELGFIPPLDEIKNRLIHQIATTLDVEWIPSRLSDRESAEIEAYDRTLLSEEELHQFRRKERSVRDVKIAEQVRILETSLKSPGGLLRLTLTVVDGDIRDVLLSGDFYSRPLTFPDEFARTLIGLPYETLRVKDAIARLMGESRFETPGVETEHLHRLVDQLAETPS